LLIDTLSLFAACGKRYPPEAIFFPLVPAKASKPTIENAVYALYLL
jgi:hypothetical protein